MEWSKVLPAIIAILTAFLLPIIFSKRKKEGSKKKKDYSLNLDELGIKFEKIEKEDERISFVKKLSLGQKAEGIFALKKKNIDYIFIISITSQYGTNYFLEFIIKNTFNLRDEPIKNTRMKLKKDSLISKKYVDILWIGDMYLAQKLNMDYDLKYKLLHRVVNEQKIILRVIPDKKRGYTRIRTNFVPLSDDFIASIDSIAGHIKTGL
jgi:lipopolysaccharide export LptBFGC system permease protein LptF